MAISSSSMPRDIVANIHSRLPVRSLLRFRTVSKYWLSIISKPQFIHSHSLIAALKKPSILVSETLYATPKDFEYIFMPKISDFKDCHFIGSCNGIVCLADHSGDVICLWNPSTKKCTKLPPPKEYSDTYWGRPLGFGYDSLCDDYVVVCPQNQRDDDCLKLVQLFSTNAGFWREVRAHIPLPCAVFNNSVLVINGLLYFLGNGYNNKEIKLIPFDLHNEIFGVVTPPSCMKGKRSNFLDFEGSLAIMIFNSIHDQGISLWTLKDGSDLSWIKKFTIEADELSWIDRFDWFENGLWVDLYMGGGQFYGRNYVEDYSPGYHVISHIWFDYKKNEGNCFYLRDTEYPDILKYTESLASITGFKSTERMLKKQARQRRRMRRRRMRRTGHKVLKPANNDDEAVSLSGYYSTSDSISYATSPSESLSDRCPDETIYTRRLLKNQATQRRRRREGSHKVLSAANNG